MASVVGADSETFTEGKMITDAQVKYLIREFNRTESIRMSAMKSGMNRKTASSYLASGALPSELKTPHTWRTRPDPFAQVTEEIDQMLGVMPELEAKTLFEYLQDMHSGMFVDGQLRTLQRRVHHWRLTKGPGLEVFFPF